VLPQPPPLRTVLVTFETYGSSLYKIVVYNPAMQSFFFESIFSFDKIVLKVCVVRCCPSFNFAVSTNCGFRGTNQNICFDNSLFVFDFTEKTPILESNSCIVLSLNPGDAFLRMLLS
jgi:hypothetical protein